MTDKHTQPPAAEKMQDELPEPFKSLLEDLADVDPLDLAERWAQECVLLQAKVKELEAEVEHLTAMAIGHEVTHEKLRALQSEPTALREREAVAYRGLCEIREIYCNMEGFVPETAPEGYVLQEIKKMYDTAVEHIKLIDEALKAQAGE